MTTGINTWVLTWYITCPKAKKSKKYSYIQDRNLQTATTYWNCVFFGEKKLRWFIQIF